MVILSGIRRAGKTTLLFQIIDELLRKRAVNPYEILYYSFDEERGEIKDILDEYQSSVLKTAISTPGRVILFFDEIQKLENWPEKIKIIYDLHPNIKLFLSGSAAIDIRQGTRESLAGRFFDFHIEPLDFEEYLVFMDRKIDKEREGIFELEIRRSLEHYLESGGFIEALGFDEHQRRKYFKEGLLERVVFRDLPSVFTVRSPELLYRLITVFAHRPGMYLDYKNLGNDLGYDQRTISDYTSYLEHALILSKLYNYSPNRLTNEKKMKRVYLSSAAFSLALAGQVDRSLLFKQFFVNVFKARFFSKTPQGDEVDIVLDDDDEIMPVEIKLKKEIKRRDAVALSKFMKRHSLKKGILVSENVEASFADDSLTTEIIPYWKYWTLKKKLTSHR